MSTLARYRAEKGETQAGFAARLGITQGFVSQLEKRKLCESNVSFNPTGACVFALRVATLWTTQN